MRLRTVLFDCPKSVLDALESCNIESDEDFLFSMSAVALFQKLPPGILTYAELEGLRSRVARSLAVDGLSGEEILRQEMNDSENNNHDHHIWTTGVYALDHLLRAVGHGILEVAGGRGSGKTGLALALAMQCLGENSDNEVHWIDTTGEFSAERAALLQKQLSRDSHRQHAAAIDSALQRLHVSMAFTPEEGYDVLQAIRSGLQYNSNQANRQRVRLVVIDPVTPLFGPHLSTISSEGHAMMTAFMKELRSLAVDKSLLVLVTNTATDALPSNPTSAFASTKLKPALGPTFSFLTDATLWISRCQDVFTQGQTESNTYIAEIIRSRVTMDRRWWTFNMAGVLRETSQTEIE